MKVGSLRVFLYVYLLRVFVNIEIKLAVLKMIVQQMQGEVLVRTVMG